MNNKDLPMMVALAKAVSGSSGGGSSLPEPVTNNVYTGDCLMGVTNSRGVKSWLVGDTVFQILVSSNSSGVISVNSGRSSKNADILSLLTKATTDIDTNFSQIVLRWASGKLPGDTEINTIRCSYKCSGFAIHPSTDVTQLYFPYTHISDSDTLVKGLFVVTLSDDNTKSIVYYPET